MGRSPGGRNGRRCRRRTTHSDGTAPPALPKPHQHQYCHTGGAAKNILSERLADRSLIVSALSEQGFLLYLRNARSEEHTSELQSRPHLVCRLLLEKKKK